LSQRLPTHVEVAGILRRVSAGGDFASVIRKGDPERGSLLILVSSRGRHVACLERVLDFNSGDYHWQPSGPPESADLAKVSSFVANRQRLDSDLWAIELDIAEPERFIAETTRSG
jgi:hypothetical protein